MQNLKYFEYLNSISPQGKWYRRNIVYPFITRYSFGKILDVGCGTGLFLEYAKNTSGVDINPLLVDQCRSKGLNVIKMEIDELPFSDNSFDTCILDNVLEHIENPNPIILEIKRILRRNGRLIVGVPGEKGYLRDPDHKQFYDIKDLINLFEGHHFTTLKTKRLPFRGLSKMLSAYTIFVVFEI